MVVVVLLDVDVVLADVDVVLSVVDVVVSEVVVVEAVVEDEVVEVELVGMEVVSGGLEPPVVFNSLPDFGMINPPAKFVWKYVAFPGRAREVASVM